MDDDRFVGYVQVLVVKRLRVKQDPIGQSGKVTIISWNSKSFPSQIQLFVFNYWFLDGEPLKTTHHSPLTIIIPPAQRVLDLRTTRKELRPQAVRGISIKHGRKTHCIFDSINRLIIFPLDKNESTMQLVFSASLLLLGFKGANAAIPKMLSEPAWTGKAIGPPAAELSLSSNSTTYFGDCDPGHPFEFFLYGPSGVGAVGVTGEASKQGIVVEVSGAAEVYLGKAEQRFFGFEDGAPDEEDYQGYPLEYMVDPIFASKVMDGISAQVKCAVATPIVVIMNDNVDLEIHALVTESTEGDEIELLGAAGEEALQGSTRSKKNSKTNSPVSFDSASNKKIKMKHEKGNQGRGVALVDGFFTSPEGYKVRRTLIRESKPKKDTFRNPANVPVKCCDITEDGDVEISFPGLANKDETFRVDVRLGISIEGASTPVEVVDVSSMITQDGTMTVHGGWFRNAIGAENMEETIEGWDVVVMNAIVMDPEDEYRIVGVMKKAIQNGVPSNQKSKRGKLSQKPTAEEVSVNEDMKVGKKPSKEQRERHLGHRRLSGGHKKILVHGYCSTGNQFPTSHFTDAIAFSDPAAPTSWSHNQFALKIDSFADANGLHGCGCIAHSQGGAACLHLYANYWSCLDYPETSGRRIQSVGTPYQGTPLAGSIAAIGDIFGAGCGSNSDLTTSGASTWLSGIPSWARAAVTYYTTSFEDKWWRWDYCHLASDILLGDPDDGTTEKSKGQLSGGNNGGHKSNQCHTSGMRDPPQYQDSSRNSAMNANAQF